MEFFLGENYGLVAYALAKSRVSSMSVDLIRTSSSYFDKQKFSSAEVFSVSRASRPRSDVISRPRILAEVRICRQQDSRVVWHARSEQPTGRIRTHNTQGLGGSA